MPESCFRWTFLIGSVGSPAVYTTTYRGTAVERGCRVVTRALTMLERRRHSLACRPLTYRRLSRREEMLAAYKRPLGGSTPRRGSTTYRVVDRASGAAIDGHSTARHCRTVALTLLRLAPHLDRPAAVAAAATPAL